MASLSLTLGWLYYLRGVETVEPYYSMSTAPINGSFCKLFDKITQTINQIAGKDDNGYFLMPNTLKTIEEKKKEVIKRTI